VLEQTVESVFDQAAMSAHHSEIIVPNSNLGQFHDPHSFSKNSSHDEGGGISLAHWNWEHVKVNLVIILFIIFSGVAKLVFHKAHWLSSRVPESCLLIILGVAFGGCLYEAVGEGQKEVDTVLPRFSSDMFFLYLLPPIILEASWSLYNNNFFSNIRAILLFAVVGTIINFLLIGGLLLIVVNADLVSTNSLTTIQIFLFASLISAVDPVAVLSIFTEVGVNPHLYFLVFGESLLNDGVAVVLYSMMNSFAGMESLGQEIGANHILTGCGSFITIALGGLSIGIIIGLLTSLLTRCTKDVRIIEPLALFCGGYLAYIMAELVHWSGIISLIGCGLVQAHYAFKNISSESRTTVNYFIKMASSTSDCIIFLYLGIAWFCNNHVWDTGFVLWSVLFVFVVRFFGTFILCFYLNWLRRNIHPITFREMFVMAYGGLRGAVGFSLVITINSSHVPSKDMLVTTTLVVIMQTVFLQGGTIKWLVNKLKIEKSADSGKSLMLEMNNKLFEHIMAGIECLDGKHGQYYFMDRFNRFDEKYLMKIFCNSDAEHEMVRMYDEVSINDHFLHLYGPSLITADVIKDASGSVGQNCHDNRSFVYDTLEEKNSKTISEVDAHHIPSAQACKETLMAALEQNLVNKLHHVVDKNLARVEEHDVEFHLKQRKNSAKKIRRRIMSESCREKSDQPVKNGKNYHSFRAPSTGRVKNGKFSDKKC